jgi:hypothetical protein
VEERESQKQGQPIVPDFATISERTLLNCDSRHRPLFARTVNMVAGFLM